MQRAQRNLPDCAYAGVHLRLRRSYDFDQAGRPFYLIQWLW
jgi:hypothetical protein